MARGRGKTHKGKSSEPIHDDICDFANPWQQRLMNYAIWLTVLVAILSIVFSFYYGDSATLNYLYSNEFNGTLAFSGDVYSLKYKNLTCSDDYENNRYPGCLPIICGRGFVDNLIEASDVERLLSLAMKGLAHARITGGYGIIDLHSGATTYGDKFINVYNLPIDDSFMDEVDLATYDKVRLSIMRKLVEIYGLNPDKIYSTYPTFFSQLSNRSAVALHDEYWHPHVDKSTYGSFHYTSLIYLSTYGLDFSGGRFIFIDKNSHSKIEPRSGRVSFFTSGSENTHRVEKVESGLRYALTMGFTCDSGKDLGQLRMHSIKQ